MIQAGYLDADGNAIKKAGIETLWDDTAQSPYIIDTNTGAFITYDDTKSLGIKSKWAKDNGLMGVKLWAVQLDTTDGKLIKAIKEHWT